MIDIKESKKIKEKVFQDAKNYQNIIEDTSLGICIIDKSSGIEAINQSLCCLLGYSAEEIVGQNFLILIPPFKQSEIKKLIEMFWESEVSLYRNWMLVNKNREQICMSTELLYLKKINNQACGLSIMAAY